MCNVFDIVKELRDLQFGVTIGTLGPDMYNASYVYWPLVEAENNGTLAIDVKTARLLRTGSAIEDSPDQAIIALKKLALSQLPNLERFSGRIKQPSPPAS